MNGFLWFLCFSDCDLKGKRPHKTKNNAECLDFPPFLLPWVIPGCQQPCEPHCVALTDCAAHRIASSVCILLRIHFNLYFNSLLPASTTLYLCSVVASGYSGSNLDGRPAKRARVLNGDGQGEARSPPFHRLHPFYGT